MTAPFAVPIEREEQVVALRQQARAVAAQLGFDTTDQARIATAVSEIARNAVRHAGGGVAAFAIERMNGEGAFVVRVTDRGPGLAGLDTDEPGPVPVQRGSGLGLAGAARLVDRLQASGRPGRGPASRSASACRAERTCMPRHVPSHSTRRASRAPTPTRWSPTRTAS